jgi:hypothetical protein
MIGMRGSSMPHMVASQESLGAIDANSLSLINAGSLYSPDMTAVSMPLRSPNMMCPGKRPGAVDPVNHFDNSDVVVFVPYHGEVVVRERDTCSLT